MRSTEQGVGRGQENGKKSDDPGGDDDDVTRSTAAHVPAFVDEGFNDPPQHIGGNDDR